MTFTEKTKHVLESVASSVFWAYATAKLKVAAWHFVAVAIAFVARHFFKKGKSMQKVVQIGQIGSVTVASADGVADVVVAIQPKIGGGSASGVVGVKASVEFDLEEREAADLAVALVESKFKNPAIVAALEGLKAELDSVLAPAPVST